MAATEIGTPKASATASWGRMSFSRDELVDLEPIVKCDDTALASVSDASNGFAEPEDHAPTLTVEANAAASWGLMSLSRDKPPDLEAIVECEDTALASASDASSGFGEPEDRPLECPSAASTHG